MPQDRTIEPVKSRTVLGATELTLLAPIRRGPIPALDARSYVSRAALVLETLHALGVSRREVDPTPGLLDVADELRMIRSFRLAIVGRDAPQILLSVSFDGGWEPYIRRIWNPLGPLLDLIFCNCEGYLLSTTHPFRAYAGWVRQAQVKTGFYYEDSPLTVADLQVVRAERGRPAPAPAGGAASVYDQARPALRALYRLSDMHPPLPGNEDAAVLWRAAQLLLMRGLQAAGNLPLALPGPTTPADEAAWTWFVNGPPTVPLALQPPLPQAVDLSKVQSGILEGHDKVAHGCLVLVGLVDAAGVERLITHLRPGVFSASAPPFQVQNAGNMYCTLAFTHAGLALAGVDAGTLQQLPKEFREGMEARASVLGDWLHNHPSKWTLPEAWAAGLPRVELSRVHAVVRFESSAYPAQRTWQSMQDPHKADLLAAVNALDQALGRQGEVLAVQPMQRLPDDTTPSLARGHFGFVDGLSQPGLPRPGRLARDEVAAGELLLGYPNDPKAGPSAPADGGLEGRLWRGSTFMVVRKLRQHVDRWDAQVRDPNDQARLMGRMPDGQNLIDGTTGNDFDYQKDPDGQACPLFAHVRRAHPRQTRPDLPHLPRIVRRGMSYGPEVAPDRANASADRGLVFVAFNASIAEQFEVIQRWLAGANSAGGSGFSGLRDPIVGVPLPGDSITYSWPATGHAPARPVVLPAGSVALNAKEPLVSLQWGLYAFVPSLPALDELRRVAAETAAEDAIRDPDAPEAGVDLEVLQRKRDRRQRERAALAARGSQLIGRLRYVEQTQGVDAAVEAWKLALEDLGARHDGASQAIWAAVRDVHGGALRTPYGVLVGSRSLVDEVFADSQQRYTVSGYNTRLAGAFGEIYLGRDADDPAYKVEATPANAAVMKVDLPSAFDHAHACTVALLAPWKKLATPDNPVEVDVKDLVDGMLAAVCPLWFGLPDGVRVQSGGWHWRAEATCPGHFHAPSRYTFQPRPGSEASRVGRDHGALLKRQVLDFVEQARKNLAAKGVIGQALFAAQPDNDRLASTLIGVMMGFLPTVDGNLRGALYEWVVDRSLWDLQARLRSETPRLGNFGASAQELDEPLQRAMQRRPVPELVWRTAKEPHRLGGGPSPVDVRGGDTVVVGIVSAMHEDRLAERPGPFVVFGGDRRAPPSATAPVPTHACPGYEMAIGVMWGFLHALLTEVELRPAASPMAVRIVG